MEINRDGLETTSYTRKWRKAIILVNTRELLISVASRN